MITVHLIMNLQLKRKPLKVSLAQRPAVRIICTPFHSQKWCWLAPGTSLLDSARIQLPHVPWASHNIAATSKGIRTLSYEERDNQNWIIFVSQLPKSHGHCSVAWNSYTDPPKFKVGKWSPPLEEACYSNRVGRACRTGWRSLWHLWETAPMVYMSHAQSFPLP